MVNFTLPRLFFRTLVTICLCGAMCSTLIAQGTAAATILGTITDSSGAAVPDVDVQVTNIATGIIQTTKSDEQGRYRVPDLVVGSYEVRAEKEGFQLVVHTGIELTVGSESVVDVHLTVGKTTEAVTVQGDVSEVDTTTSEVSTLISQNQMRELPLNGRNFEQLVLLAPGVQVYQGFQAGSYYGSGNGYTVAGSRPNGQAELLDNTDIQDYFNRGSGAGVLGTSMGVDAIAEFQLLTNTYSAQFGGNGSVLNAVSKSGTNDWHGSVYEFLRNSALDARNYFDGPTIAPFRRNQFGGTLGGPISKSKKMFFFVNYEGLRQLLGETRVANVPDANARAGFLPTGPNGSLQYVGISPAVAPYMNFFPLPTKEIGGGIGSVLESGSQIGNENYFLGRYDWTMSDKDSFFARYTIDFASLLEPFGSPGALPLWPTNNVDHNQFFTMEEKHLFGNNVINLIRFGFSRPYQNSNTTESYAPFQFLPVTGLADGTIAIAGLSSLGANTESPFLFVQNKFNYADDVYWTKGAHNLKFGASVTRVQSNVNSPFPSNAQWTFNSLQLFMQDDAFQVNGPLPGQTDAHRDFRELDFAFYAQDDWRVSPTLTLNLGLRYAPTTNPNSTSELTAILDPPYGTGFVPVSNVFANNPSLKNFDPRIGLAWDPFPDHRTAVRAGFGVFHNVYGPREYASGYYFTPPFSVGTQIDPNFPTPFTSLTPTARTVVYGFDRNNGTTPYQEQWNLNVQREISRNTVAMVGYVGSRGNHLMVQNDLNPPIPTILPDGQMQFSQLVDGKIVSNPLINPTFGYLSMGQDIGWSTYNSLQGTIDRRMTDNLSFQASYTYSHCIDISSGSWSIDGGTVLSNPYDPDADKGNCVFDIRNNFVANGVYAFPFTKNRMVSGWQLTTIFDYHSGTPINITDGFVQAFQNGTTANRPNGVPGCTDEILGTVAHWFNPACFSLPAVGFLGDVGRNSITGPNSIDLDMGLLKSTKITERITMQFRAEGFNVLNRANFRNPSGSVFVQSANGGGTVSPTAGQITATNTTSRQIQFGLKVLF